MSDPRDPNQPGDPNRPPQWQPTRDPASPPDWNAVGASRPTPPEPGQPARSDEPVRSDEPAASDRPGWDDRTTVSPTQPGDENRPPTWAPSFYSGPPPEAAPQPAAAWQPSPAPVATERVEGRSSAARWAVALGATALILIVGLAVLLFARQGTTSTAAAPGYLPPDTVAYGEFRLDLPGDQRDNLGRFLAHFPGFADQSTLEAKLDDVFDRLFLAASQDRYRWTTEVKPWFGGQVAFGLMPPPDGEATPAPPIVIVTVKDQGAAQVVLDRLRADATDASWVSKQHGGTTIWSAQLESAEAGVDGLHYALTADALLMGGRLADVEAALDRKSSGGDSLGGSDEFNTALAGLREDRLATIWLDTSLIKEKAIEQLESAGATPGTEMIRSLLDDIPNRIVMEAHFEPDRFVAEARSDTPGGAPEAKASELADNAPQDALAYLEWRDVGQGLGEVIRQLKEDPTIREAAPQLTQVEAFLGGSLESFVDWIGDVAITGSVSGDQPSFALLATARNEEQGRQRLGQLAALLQFAGQLGIQINSEDIDGTTITTLVIPSNLGTGLGAPLPPGAVPENVEISYGLKNGVFVVAATAEEAVRLLNLPSSQSLAGTERFRTAVEAAGGEQNVGVSWLDVAGIRTAIEGLLPAEQREMYEREIKPYLEPLDLFVGVGLLDGDDLVQRSIITVK